MGKNPLIGVAVMVFFNGKVLLGKRKNTHGAGTWQLPGGHLEFFESIETCGRREVFEETGLVIQNIRRGPYTNDIFEKEGRHYVTLFLIADAAGGELAVKEPEKCEKWAWFDWADLPDPKFLPLANLLGQGYDPRTGE
ncbi:MAG TPA: NUDIX hydrolase [Desulfosalsimonadaceae bacterium]|nr:NUDIX hydrolase [Desulfosalsimonadaceae bacterium]